MENKIKKETWLNVLIAVASVAVVGVAGRLLTDTKSGWYTALDKPSEFLPEAVFPVMWTLIYIAFAVTIFLLLEKKQMDVKCVILFVLNGLLQLLWSLVYFRLKSLLGGLIVIVLVLAASVWLIAKLDKKGVQYKYILLIYPVWVTLATLVNAALWAIN